MKLTEFKV